MSGSWEFAKEQLDAIIGEAVLIDGKVAKVAHDLFSHFDKQIRNPPNIVKQRSHMAGLEIQMIWETHEVQIYETSHGKIDIAILINGGKIRITSNLISYAITIINNL